MEELEALVTLSETPQLGIIKIKQLLQEYGSASEAIKAGWGVANKVSLNFLEKNHTEIIPFYDPRYPKRLLEIHDHPLFLYVKGEIKPSDERSIAIVGTRNATIYGNEMAEKIASELTSSGYTVVSGLARGIDTSAHRGALMNGRTLAVIGSGLNNIYPKENAFLAEEISHQGAVISEFSINTPPNKSNFPRRNRIVSALTLGTLLIEAPEKSGAMITMEKAKSQGRPLFALPGRVDIESFKGNHLLIKSGQAKLVENAADILSHFNDLFSFAFNPKPKAKPLSQEEESLLEKLPNEELAIEEILKRTDLPVVKLNILLMSLVLRKAIREYPGKVYKKVV